MARQHGFVQQLVRTQHGPAAKSRRLLDQTGRGQKYINELDIILQ